MSPQVPAQPALPAMALAAQRVLGWDVLRGLCALAVASYHLLYWQGIATLHTLGSYGVYLFFVLSGASLAYNYSGRLKRSGDAATFLLTRWLRLAPLHGILCVVFIGFLAARDGALVDLLALRLLVNATFAFGLHDPTIWALLIGGWSLGIEFVYYLVFPVLVAALPRVGWSIALAVALCLLQWHWIYATVGSAAGYEAGAIAYHQVPGFVAYFFGGCIIGHWRRAAASFALSRAAGILVWLLMAALLLGLNPSNAGDELLGARGAILFCACFAVVFASGSVSVHGKLAPVARWLGDITYGCYLLHPMFFFGFVWFVLPRLSSVDITQAPLAWRWALLAAVLALSCVTAAASERWLEAPLRRWGKRVLGGRQAAREAPYNDATSISS
jgi:peptidoglycan/LPS O-acetylase OafA/YrhL